ncbi:MAG: urease accessory protein UreD, partial [Rhodobacterales bacterium]|nr:urease accessory protein UreD [Rhodobacterales bacterium]
FLNTAGGLTGGDDLRLALALGPGVRAVATTQTAERAYASTGAPARMEVSLTLAAGARLDWLPQETILFDRSHLHRRTRADLAGDAQILMAEVLVMGRAAMGEVLTRLALQDRREIWRAGRPVWIDPVTLDPAALGATAGLAGARAVATLVLVAPGAEDALAPLRAVLDPTMGAASAWDGRMVLRLAGPDLFPVKAALAAALSVIRRGAPPPRVWQR